MDFNENDQKILEMLEVTTATDEEKKAILDEVDQKMGERFVANLLNSMDAESAKKMQDEIDKLPNDDPAKVIETIITSHPDATTVLEKTAQEVLDEFKKARQAKLNSTSGGPAENVNDKPPIEQAAPKEPNLTSDGTLSDTSTSELDKNIADLGGAGNEPAPAVAPEPPQAPAANSSVSEPATTSPQNTSAAATDEAKIPAPQEEGPLNVSFGSPQAEASTENSSAHLPADEPEQPAPLPTTPEPTSEVTTEPEASAPVVEPPTAPESPQTPDSPQTGEPTPATDQIPSSEAAPEAAGADLPSSGSMEAATPAPAAPQAPVATEPAEDAAPWSFSATNAPEPNTQPEGAADSVPNPGTPSASEQPAEPIAAAPADSTTSADVAPTGVDTSAPTEPAPPAAPSTPPTTSDAVPPQPSSPASISDLYK